LFETGKKHDKIIIKFFKTADGLCFDKSVTIDLSIDIFKHLNHRVVVFFLLQENFKSILFFRSYITEAREV
jgi:hypothetical protein